MPWGRPMTVVFSANSNATPRTMNEVPSVTMKAGTLSLAMIVPLTSPTMAAPPTAARKPMMTDGNSGTPALKAARIASAESTEARLITQPTDRSMPAPMMTKVWPSPSSRIGMMATRMFCELRIVRKLAPSLAIGTATTKKMISTARNAQAQSRLSARTTRSGAASPASEALNGRSSCGKGAPGRAPRWRYWPGTW